MARKHTKNRIKKKRGRPSKFNQELVAKAEKYYKECLDRNIMPFIEDLQLILGVDDDTIVQWAKDIKHKKAFSATYGRIKILQRKSLKRIAISNYKGAIFLLKANHGMVETQHLQLSGKEEEEPITLVVSRMPEEGEKNDKTI